MSTDPILPENFVSRAFSLDGRVAVVAGGGGGLGAAVCAGLAQAGARIVVLDIDAAAARTVANGVTATGAQAFPLQCDVSHSGSVRDAVDSVIAQEGRVDVLVNSAGTAFRCPAEGFPEDQFDRILALNLKGTYLTCQAFGREMLKRGSGSIINIGSIGSFVGYPDASAYLASKGGVLQITRGLALEWIGRVRVNGIAPTLVDTPLTHLVAQHSTTTSDFIARRRLRDHLASPRHIVGAAVFLASDASELVTGHMLPVDDGYLIA